ncbi:MAG: lysophospholipid acyltransferase family protein [Pseudomonadota bacterium]
MGEPSPRADATAPVDPFPVRIVKRVALVVFGPLYFLFIAVAPVFCRNRKGFRGWYWRLVKRACSRLLRLLSINVEMSAADKARIGADENSIIVINHRSHLDGFTLMDVIPDAKWYTFAAKSEFWRVALLRAGFDGAGLIPINRESGRAAMGVLGEAIAKMPARRSVIMFPEGTRTKSESLGAFKAGAVLVARATGRAILPIVIHDTEKVLPHGSYLPKSGTVRIEALEAFRCDLSATVDQDVARLRAAMMTAFDRG